MSLSNTAALPAVNWANPTVMMAVPFLSLGPLRLGREPEAMAFSHSEMTHLKMADWLSAWIGSSSGSSRRSMMAGRFQMMAIIIWTYARMTRAWATHCLV